MSAPKAALAAILSAYLSSIGAKGGAAGTGAAKARDPAMLAQAGRKSGRVRRARAAAARKAKPCEGCYKSPCVCLPDNASCDP